MTREEVLKELRALVHTCAEDQILVVDITTFSELSHLREDLEFDHVDRLELVLLLEKKFGIRIPDTEEPRWETIADIVDYLVKRTDE